MCISPDVRSGSDGQHGGCPASFAELRHQLADPSQLNDVHRQRLLDLGRRVARVQRLGGACRRVCLSEFVVSALNENTAVV